MIQEFLVGIDVPWFLQCIVCIIIIIAVYFLLNYIFKKENLRGFIGKYPPLSLLFISIIIFCQLEIANHSIFFRTMSLINIGINILTLFSFMEILYVLLNRAWISIIVCEVITAIVGIANYYTLYFRGTPITAQNIPSAGTAINVLPDLEFSLMLVASFLLLVTICCILYACFLRQYEIISKGKAHTRAINAAASFFFLWFIYCCSYSPKPANTSAWIWRDQ